MSPRMSLVKTTGALSTKKDMLQAMPGLISKQKVRLMQSPVHFTSQSCKVADQPFPWLLAAIGKQDYSPLRELVSQICQANEAAFIPLQRVKARDIIPWKQLRVAAMAALSSRIPAKKRRTVVKPVKNKHRCKRKLSEAMPQQIQQPFSCLTARKKIRRSLNSPFPKLQ